MIIERARVNGRGFQVASFKDTYGEECSIQQSSNGTHLWVGCDHETIHQTFKTPCGARMHLDVKLAKMLVKRIQKWIDTGRI